MASGRADTVEAASCQATVGRRAAPQFAPRPPAALEVPSCPDSVVRACPSAHKAARRAYKRRSTDPRRTRSSGPGISSSGSHVSVTGVWPLAACFGRVWPRSACLPARGPAAAGLGIVWGQRARVGPPAGAPYGPERAYTALCVACRPPAARRRPWRRRECSRSASAPTACCGLRAPRSQPLTARRRRPRASCAPRVEYTEEDPKPQLEEACRVDCLKEWHNYKVQTCDSPAPSSA